MKITEKQIKRLSEEYGIGVNVIYSLQRYTDNHIPTGGFLEAVLSNNLFEAMGRADHISRKELHGIVRYIYNQLPSGCWGSKKLYNAHLKKRAL